MCVALIKHPISQGQTYMPARTLLVSCVLPAERPSMLSLRSLGTGVLPSKAKVILQLSRPPLGADGGGIDLDIVVQHSGDEHGCGVSL